MGRDLSLSQAIQLDQLVGQRMRRRHGPARRRGVLSQVPEGRAESELQAPAMSDTRPDRPVRSPRTSPAFADNQDRSRHLRGSMRSYLDFEKPVAELEAKVEELRALRDRRQRGRHRRGDHPPRGQGGAGAQGPLCRAHALAEDAGRPPSRAAPLPRLCRRPDHRLRAARPATASSATTTRSSAASAASAARASASSATRRARRPRAASSTISAWRGRRAIARRSG